MGNSKAKITNWSQYNRALCKRGDVLFGLMIQPLKHGNVPRTMGIEAEGSKILPTAGLAVFYMASFYCLTFSLRVIPIGVLYATWSGMGIFLITIFGYFIYRQSVNWQTILGLCLIIIGVILVNSFAELHSDSSA